ncbi:MAG: leucine-rich repeat domain-containing protein, partial [Alphaproteobacteria bacterium]|nr:leucine-rich repeat domain-containing protein [Alphaproteobacteria bacterium]
VTNLVIGNAVNSIGNYAFEDMDGLTNLVIPDSVTSIGENAFQDMRELETLVIGDSVTAIGKDAFKNISPSAKIYCTKNSDCLTDTLANPDNVITYFKDKSGLFALTNENGDILEDTNGNPIYYLSANDMTAQSNACLGGYQTCAEQALHNKALALLEKGRVCQTFDTCQALVNTDYNGDVIKLGGKDYASLSDLLKGISMPKRIYTVEEAAALSKKTGNTFRLRYK